jgi:hypothetical protein
VRTGVVGLAPLSPPLGVLAGGGPCITTLGDNQFLMATPPFAAGDLHMYGRAGVQFFTQPKTVTAKWSMPSAPGPMGGRIPGLDRVGA